MISLREITSQPSSPTQREDPFVLCLGDPRPCILGTISRSVDRVLYSSDPNDVLVLMQEPEIPGCFLRAWAIGLMPMINQGKKGDKIIADCADDPQYKHYNDIRQLLPHRLSEIRRFFEDYKNNENKEVAVNEFLSALTALEAIQHSI